MTASTANALRALGTQIDRLAADAAGNARRLAALCLMAEECGRSDLLYGLAREARALAPRDPEVIALTQPALAFDVQSWHVRMLGDEERHDRYRAAIERLIRPGDRVLDIGCGTGLLAMIAARAGAAHVYSCEAIPAIADVARDIVALNGLADRITILPRRSSQLDPLADLGGPVDALVSEIIGSNIIGENMLPAIEDAVRRLLKPGGRMRPLAGDVVIALADIASLDPHPIAVAGFDLSMIQRLSPRPQLVAAGRRDIVLRSKPANLYRFDFTGGGPWGDARVSRRLVADGGRVNGVLMWMRLTIDAVETYESNPVAGRASHWMNCFYRLDAPRNFAPGEPVTINAARRTTSIQLWVRETAG